MPPLDEIKFKHTTRLPLSDAVWYGRWKWIYEDETIKFDMIGEAHASV